MRGYLDPRMAKILVVDDDLDMTLTLGEILRQDGHQVRSANSGEDGLLTLNAGPLPDVVVLDVDMPPGMSGPAMAHQMLMHDAGQERIPVILMSGNSELPEIAARMGTPYFLFKPGSLTAFLDLLDRARSELVAPASA